MKNRIKRDYSWLCNWISTCLSNIHYSCGLVWFGSVAEMQTKPNCAVQCKSHLNSSEPSAIFCGFGGLVCGFSIGLVRF